MSLRHCVYKGCENNLNLRDNITNKPNLTFFQFPKDPEKREKWIELGQVPNNCHPKLYFFCSDHFDKRYLCVNPRRTTLVSVAIPFACPLDQSEKECAEVEQSCDIDSELNDESSGSFSLKQDDNDEQYQLQVESTTMQEDEDDIIQLHCELNDDCVEYVDVKNIIEYHENNRKREDNFISLAPTTTTSVDCELTPVDLEIVTVKSFSFDALKTDKKIVNKRKRSECVSSATTPSSPVANKKTYSIISQESMQITKPSSNKISQMQSNTPKLPDNKCDISDSVENCSAQSPLQSDINPEELIDNKQVTTFIFKGEEYVQMEKSYYIAEKRDMAAKLRKMEKVIAAIKQQMDSL